LKYWGIIADNLKKAGFSLGWVSALDDNGRTVWTVDAHCDGKRFVVRADEKLTPVFGSGKDDLRIRGGFDLVNHFVVAVWRAKEATA
jgi:hypothetical protein